MTSPWIPHVEELRSRLIKSVVFFVILFILCYWQASSIFGFLAQPLIQSLKPEGRFIYTGITEAFFTYLKVAFFSAIWGTLPVILWNIWRFVAPGLYREEKKTLGFFLFLSPMLFFLGGIFAYYVIMPPAWSFFVGFESSHSLSVPITFEARIGEYLSMVMTLLMAFGLCFQLPLVLIMMDRFQWIDGAQLKAYRRHSFLGILILSACVTPPDVLSMITLAIPLYGMYELTLMYILRYKKDKKDVGY